MPDNKKGRLKTFQTPFSLILFGKGLTFNVSTFVILPTANAVTEIPAKRELGGEYGKAILAESFSCPFNRVNRKVIIS